MSARKNRHGDRPKPRRTERIHLSAGPGAAPGQLDVDPNAPKPRIRVTAYGPDGASIERSGTDPALVYELPLLLEKYPVTWIDVDGLGDAGVLEYIANTLALHRLAMEDVIHVHQRPKVEDYGTYLFIVSRMVRADGDGRSEQISTFLGPRWVITFQEGLPGDVFDPVRNRIRDRRGRVCSAGPDHLAYALLDLVVDNFFPVLEKLSEEIEQIEHEIDTTPDAPVLARIHDLRRELLMVRRAIWPLRDALHVISREQVSHFTEETRIYLRDAYDHTVQLIDLVETYRELSSGLIELFLSMNSNRLNEVMKVLTIISTIFIPLSFVASVYGMNFDPQAGPYSMPELASPWGYPIVIAVMLTIATGLMFYFRRNGWLGSATRD